MDGEEEILTTEKLNRTNNYLEFLYAQKERLLNTENKENLQKLNREIRHFLQTKRDLLYVFQEELPCSIDVKEEKETIERMIKDIAEENKKLYDYSKSS